MILLLGTLVLLLVKDTMGSLQQNTVLNGTSLILTWKIRMPAGKSFFAFKIYEGSLKKELAIIRKESIYIYKPDRLKGRVFNDVKSDFNTVPMVFRLRIGPMTMDDDGLVILNQVLDTGATIALYGQDSIKVTSDIPFSRDRLETPGKVIGIKAEEINAESTCVRVSFHKVYIGLSGISYQVRFVVENREELTLTTTSTKFELCDESLVNSTVNVAALFNGNLGPYNDDSVNITKRTQSIIVATKELKCKFGTSTIVGSFFGGVFLTIVALCVVYIAKKFCADTSPHPSPNRYYPDISLDKSPDTAGAVDMTIVNIQS